MSNQTKSTRVGFSRILGLGFSVALGLSVSIALVLEASGDVVLAIAGDGAILSLALALVLYLPILLTYAEMAAGKPGSASAYQISRSYGSRGLTFVIGWSMLSGLVSAAALLSLGLATRLDFSAQSFFRVDIDHLWILVAAVALGAVNEWLSTEDRWRSRSFLVWGALGVFVAILAWVGLTQPVGQGELSRINFTGHGLSTVALLGMGLWFVDLLLNHRRQMRQPDRVLRRSMMIVWFVTIALGLASIAVVRRSPSLQMDFWPEQLTWDKQRAEFLLLAVGVLIIWLALSRVISRTVRLTGALALDGYLPAIGAKRGRRFRAMAALLILGAATVSAARWVPEAQLVAVSAASFLLMTALVTLPYARRRARDLSPNRRNRMPLHPLFPGMSTVTCVGLIAVLPSIGQGVLLGWMILGAVFYTTFARRRSREAQQDEVVVGELEEVQTKQGHRILIGAGDMDQLPSLLRLGLAIGKDRQAEMVVLRVLPTTDELSMFTVQRAAEKEWEALDSRVESFESQGISISTLVRIAPSVKAGILAAASEYEVDLLLMGVAAQPRGAPPSAVLSGVFSSTSRPLIAIQGKLEGESLDVVVGTSGGPHSPLALQLGAGIARYASSQVELVSVVAKRQPEEPAHEALRKTLEIAALEEEIPHRVVEAQTVESGLLEASREKSVLVLGASIDRLLNRTVLGGVPLEVSRVREGTTLMVKKAEAAMHFWQRRVWEFLARHTPTLTVPERSQVYSQMRHSAKADADFYAYISLSSAIAIFGLLLNSAAVIIGAMLVAPLMSPILATAQGIVQGNLRMIQRAGATTLKGASVSIGVATVIAALFAELLPTEQILARTTPNLLDLGVALAAGGVGAWAVSRASGAAALPGVAIAVALVPPLCVVGYGLGTSQFWISGGAFLLFLTNLAAIVLVGALVFVLLGFRPTRVERETQVRKAAVITLLTVAILIIPLGLSTMQMSRQGRLEAIIKHEIRDTSDRSFRVWDFRVSREGRGFLVEGTIYAFEGFETERIFKFQEELQESVGVPLQVQLTVVPATLTVVGEQPTMTRPDEPSVLALPGE